MRMASGGAQRSPGGSGSRLAPGPDDEAAAEAEVARLVQHAGTAVALESLVSEESVVPLSPGLVVLSSKPSPLARVPRLYGPTARGCDAWGVQSAEGWSSGSRTKLWSSAALDA